MKLEDFRPAPGYLLVEPVERTSQFAPLSKKDDTSARLGQVVQIGPDFEDNDRIVRTCPTTIGETIVYTHFYNNDELDIQGKKYPIIRFDQMRGVFDATNPTD